MKEQMTELEVALKEISGSIDLDLQDTIERIWKERKHTVNTKGIIEGLQMAQEYIHKGIGSYPECILEEIQEEY